LIARPFGSGIEWVRVISSRSNGPSETAAQRDLGDRHLVQHAGVAQLLAQQEGGERRGVHRRLQARPQPVHGAQVVFVGVGQDDAEDVVGVGLDVFWDPAG
jgi:hypothetical protein